MYVQMSMQNMCVQFKEQLEYLWKCLPGLKLEHYILKGTVCLCMILFVFTAV